MSRHITRCKPEYQSALRPDLSEEGWYEPEDLKTLQQLFDGLWLVLRKQVFPWDVEASREMLAIQLFQSIPDAGSNPDQLKQEILTLWQIRQQEVKRSGSTRHTVMGSKTRLWATDLRFTAPSAPMTTRMHMIADRFVVEIARVYQDRCVPVGQRTNLVTDSLAQAISLAKDMMTLEAWPHTANGFRILTPDGVELYRFSD